MVYGVVSIIFNKRHVHNKETCYELADEVKLLKEKQITEDDEFYYLSVNPKYYFNTKIFKREDIDNFMFIISCPVKRKYSKLII
jgi:hypothetical protein